MTSTARRRGPVVSLAVGSVVSGALAYVFFVTATRTLDAQDAASVSVLWTLWSLTSAAVTFPLQHWIARTVEATGSERAVREALPRLVLGLLAVAGAAGLGAALVSERLFPGQGPSYAVLVSLITLGAGLLGLVRGRLTAQRRLSWVGLNLVLENAVRSAAALLLAATGHSSAWTFGVALLGGYLVCLLTPSAIGSWDTRGGAAPTRPISAVSAVGAAGVGQLCAQVVLTGAPLVLAFGGGEPRDVTAVFAALALFRAPYTVGVSLMAPVTGWLTRTWIDGDSRTWLRVRLGVTGGAVVGAAAAAAVAWWAGPWLVGLVFGSEVEISSAAAAVLAGGTVLAMANTMVTVMLVATSHTVALVRAWTAGGVAGAVWLLAAPLDEVLSVSLLFLMVETVAFVWLVVDQSREPAASRACQALRPTAATRLFTARRAWSSLRSLKKGSRSRRPATSVVVGQSVGDCGEGTTTHGVVQRDVVERRLHPVGSQLTHHPVADLVVGQQHVEEVVGGSRRRGHDGEADAQLARRLVQQVEVALEDRAPLVLDHRPLLQLADEVGRQHVGEAEGGADVEPGVLVDLALHEGLPVGALVEEHPGAGEVVGVVEHQGPALATHEVLGLVEAEGREAPDRPQGSPLPGAEEAVGGVLDQTGPGMALEHLEHLTDRRRRRRRSGPAPPRGPSRPSARPGGAGRARGSPAPRRRRGPSPPAVRTPGRWSRR